MYSDPDQPTEGQYCESNLARFIIPMAFEGLEPEFDATTQIDKSLKGKGLVLRAHPSVIDPSTGLNFQSEDSWTMLWDRSKSRVKVSV